MSNLMKKTKKELIEIILRKDDKELELNQTIDSKQAVIDSLKNELKTKKETINELENKLSNYTKQLLETDEAIKNREQIVNDTKKHLKTTKYINNILFIGCCILTIVLCIYFLLFY